MQVAERVTHFQESVIRKMTRLAIQYQAINLSQGFPDFDPSPVLQEAAIQAIRDGHHQYSPTWGYAPLRERLAELYTERLGWTVDPSVHVTVACGVTEAMNAVLLTGDMSYLDIPRGQLDKMIDLGYERDGSLYIPNRHMDAGWSDYRVLRPEYPLQLWFMSQDDRDRERIERFPERLIEWNAVRPGRGKGDDIHIAPYYRYIEGAHAEYPQAILEAQWSEVLRRMDAMAHDDGDPEDWDVHHWQNINPVHTEALLQLTCGGPQIIYHGGLLHVRLRYFDLEARRPGLPQDVAALVDEIDGDVVRLTLVNTSPLHPRRLAIQAGAFGEHRFTQVTDVTPGRDLPATVDVNDRRLEVALARGGTLRLELGMERYCTQPSYDQPV